MSYFVRISLFLIITLGCDILHVNGFTARPSAVAPPKFSSITTAKEAFPNAWQVYNKLDHIQSPSIRLQGRFSTSLYSNRDGKIASKDELVKAASLSLKRCSWFSWWAQVILTVISSVTLIFARAVMTASSPQGIGTGRIGSNGIFFLPGAGISLSFLSILWTWGGARLARRLVRQNSTRINAATVIRRAITVGSSINLIGMFITLLGAGQIIGSLAAKVLTMQGVSPFGNAASMAVATQTLQPLDILVVQANTNTLLSHFVSLACALYLTRSVHKLDPPSVEEKRK